MYLRAAFKFKNIFMLAVGLILALSIASTYGVGWLAGLFGAAGVVAYIIGILSTAKSSKFKSEVELSEKLNDIDKLSWECNSHYRKISGRLGKNLRIKAVRVLKQKEELMNYFKHYEEDPIKQKIIEQALKLVIAYLSLASNYADSMRELSQQNLNELHARINFNNRKLGTLKNYQAVLELTKTVEMDEKLMKTLQEDREELEMINVRLDQIESTIVGFKHRILSSELSDPETEEIENVINEATALDNALNEHSRLRQRI
ncbi:MAG TPA: hypothetical protein VHT96_17520 [Clostridia bacterium]|nr:hypothetical protein [Clostridia bacterium]